MSVIHAVVDNQDLRRYGGLISFLPLTFTVILIASLSLVAFPFMTGFYSKDFILESAYGQYHFSGIGVYFIAVIGAIFTTLYSVKVIYLTFLANPNGPVNSYLNAHEGDIFLILPLVILAIFSVYFGFLTKDIFAGFASGFFMDNSIFIHPIHEILIDTEFAVPYLFRLLPLILTVLFSIFAIICLELIPSVISSFKLSNLGYYVFGFFNQRFLVEFFYNKFIVNLVLDLGGQTTKVLDKGSIEWVGPYGMGVMSTRISKIISKLSKGVVTDYALYILISICFYLSIFTFVSIFFDLVNTIILSCVIVVLKDRPEFIFCISYMEYDRLMNQNLENKKSELLLFCISYVEYDRLINQNLENNKSELLESSLIFLGRQNRKSINKMFLNKFNQILMLNVYSNIRRFSTTPFCMIKPKKAPAPSSSSGLEPLSDSAADKMTLREFAAYETERVQKVRVKPEDLVLDSEGLYVHPELEKEYAKEKKQWEELRKEEKENAGYEAGSEWSERSESPESVGSSQAGPSKGGPSNRTEDDATPPKYVSESDDENEEGKGKGLLRCFAQKEKMTQTQMMVTINVINLITLKKRIIIQVTIIKMRNLRIL